MPLRPRGGGHALAGHVPRVVVVVELVGVDELLLGRGNVAHDLGFGRIVASEIELPNMFVNLVCSG